MRLLRRMRLDDLFGMTYMYTIIALHVLTVDGLALAFCQLGL